MFIVTAVSAYQTTSPPHSRRRQCSLSQPFQPDIKTEGFSFSDMITADRSARALSSILNGVLAVGATCCSENASFCAHDSFLLLRQRNHIAPLAVLCGNVQRDCRDRVCMGFWKLILPGTEWPSDYSIKSRVIFIRSGWRILYLFSDPWQFVCSLVSVALRNTAEWWMSWWIGCRRIGIATIGIDLRRIFHLLYKRLALMFIHWKFGFSTTTCFLIVPILMSCCCIAVSPARCSAGTPSGNGLSTPKR
jgi:hypothetical protein